MAHFPLLPLLIPLCLPFVSPSTYLAPSSCDRNRPPPSQVACKLTLFAPPFTTSQSPNCPAPDNDDLGTIPCLLYGTLPSLGRRWMLRDPVQLRHPSS